MLLTLMRISECIKVKSKAKTLKSKAKKMGYQIRILGELQLTKTLLSV